MYQLAVNIDLLFSEAGPDPADRVRAAAAAGFDAVEMFGTSDKDVHRLAKVLSDHGMTVCSVVAEPYSNFTFPGTDLGPVFDGLERGVENARVLGSPRIAVTSGVGFPAVNRTENLKRLIDAMAQAVERTAGSGVTLVIEAVNTRIDDPGALLDRTEDAIAVARGVNSESLAIMYDLYHSIVNGEDPATELANAHGWWTTSGSRTRRVAVSRAAGPSTGRGSCPFSAAPATPARSAWRCSRPARRPSRSATFGPWPPTPERSGA